MWMGRGSNPQEVIAYGRRLRAAREAAGVKQRELANAIGCAQPFVSRAENGQMMLRAVDYHIVASLLGVSLDYLLGPLTAAERAEIAAADAALAEERAREERLGLSYD